MPGIKDPNEVYFKDGIWGWASTLWERLYSFSNLLGIASHGWDGSDWRKLPLVWGYSADYAELEVDTNLAAGTTDLSGTAVPSGELWVVTQATFIYTGTPPTRVRLTVIKSGDDIELVRELAPDSGQGYGWTGKAYLAEGDYMRCRVVGATAGDVLEAWFGGYKMLIAE